MSSEEEAHAGAQEAVRRGFSAFKWSPFDQAALRAHEAGAIAMLADTYYIPIAPHNPGGPICTLAAMHLAAAIPNFYILEQMEVERALRDALCTNLVQYRAGMFELPTAPGLGTDLVLDALAERGFRPQPVAESNESLWH